MKRFSLLILCGLELIGCAAGPDFERPCPPQISSYTEGNLPKKTAEAKGTGGKAQIFRLGKDIPAYWWHLFRCKPLNMLIEGAFKKNPQLQAAQAALRVAEENLRVSSASLFPAVTATPYYERQRFSADVFGASNSRSMTFNLFNTNVNVSYTLDVFGGLRRQIEASQAQVDYQAFEVEATYLTLTTNIVTAAIAEASLRSQIKVTQELISLLEKELEITKKKFELGGASRLDVLAQETQIAQTRATLPPLQKSLAQTRHGLSVLIGQLPSDCKLPTFSLSDFHLPKNLPLSLPSSLVCQRPDIRAAEALLHAASAQVGVATANLLPQITITGGYGWTANSLQSLFDPTKTVWSFLNTLTQPIFEGGALIAKRKAAIANFEQAFAQYRQVVLQAFQNVADSLRALEIDATQLKIQGEAEDAAKKTYQLTQTQYQAGAVSYLNLLDAERQYLQARISRIQALAARYADTAALFQALGGGWWNRKPSKDK